ncbi:MAG: hypothetical protein LBP27_06090 [Treponema sp.]|jgi:hypothetical protein|nr:hypothetical protein [Treponema sp.]
MKKNGFVLLYAITGLCAATALLSCAGGPKSAGHGEAGIAAPEDSRPDSAAFRDMPPEAQAYLELLARAFIDQDENFLLAQGEAQFEAEVKPGCDRETYLALLYRSGAYAAESPRAGTRNPRLNPAEIRRIEYIRWQENGPVLEIEGRFLTVTGGIIPCRIILLWRLKEPKILGRFP